MTSKILCYDCANFNDDTLKCETRKTYVNTPEKAQHCRTFDSNKDWISYVPRRGRSNLPIINIKGKKVR